MERLIHFAPGLESLAPGVRDGPDRLLQHRALGRDREIHATAAHLAGEPEMVALGIEAEEGETEAVLTTGGSVTTPCVATGLHEDGHHVKSEADGGLELGLAHLHRQSHALILE